MGPLKTIGVAAKNLPWKQIAKYGGAAVGIPIIGATSGATDEVAAGPVGDLVDDPEMWLALAQSILGAVGVFLRDWQASRRAKQTAADGP